MVRSSADEGSSEEQQDAPAVPKRRRQRKQTGFSVEGALGAIEGTIDLGRKSREAFDADGGFTLDKLNPIAMGRKSREVFDDVWAQLQRLGSSRSVVLEDDFRWGHWALVGISWDACIVAELCLSLVCWAGAARLGSRGRTQQPGRGPGAVAGCKVGVPKQTSEQLEGARLVKGVWLCMGRWLLVRCLALSEAACSGAAIREG